MSCYSSRQHLPLLPIFFTQTSYYPVIHLFYPFPSSSSTHSLSTHSMIDLPIFTSPSTFSAAHLFLPSSPSPSFPVDPLITHSFLHLPIFFTKTDLHSFFSFSPSSSIHPLIHPFSYSLTHLLLHLSSHPLVPPTFSLPPAIHHFAPCSSSSSFRLAASPHILIDTAVAHLSRCYLWDVKYTLMYTVSLAAERKERGVEGDTEERGEE